MSEFAYKEKECHMCGKKFIVQSPDQYVYKRLFGRNEKYFCSWGCLRKWEATRGSKVTRRDKIIDALKDGMSVKEICYKFDVDRTNVVYWQNKLQLKV